MNQPLWKKLASYVYEFHIESASSDYNPHLYVCLTRGRYQLCTENAIYSFSDKYDNFLDTFKRIDLDSLPGKEVLILGFGMGSIPIILERVFEKEYRYTGVEIDEVVLDLFTRYELPDINSQVELVCADAAIWVALAERKFDLILVDLFLDDVIPDKFEQQDFLSNVQQLIKPGGTMLYNRLASTKHDIETAQHFYDQKFKPVFNEGSYLKVNGNWMLINDEKLMK